MWRRRMMVVLVVAVILAGVGGLAAHNWWQALCPLPGPECVDLSRAITYEPEEASLVLAADDTTVVGRYARVYRHVVPLTELPPVLVQAFLAIEDARFYQHHGIDWRRAVGAMRANIIARRSAQGFSTITMQLARNLYPELLPAREKSLLRKAREIRVALALERVLSKDAILARYLNTIYLGAGSYGVEAASQTYFGKSARAVGVLEAAVLAALPRAPGTVNPHTRPEAARARAMLVLERMVALQWLAPAMRTAAASETWAAAPTRSAGVDTTGAVVGASYLELVRQEAQRLLGARLYTGGYRLYIHMRPEVQAAAESLVVTHTAAVQSLRAAQGLSADSVEAAVVVVAHGTGAVEAHVGGRRGGPEQFDRAKSAMRQPGSVFKPVVAAAAFAAGFTPSTLVSNAPVEVLLEDGEIWRPSNFDGLDDSASTVTLGDALVRSLNRPMVRIGQLIGWSQVDTMARAMGWTGASVATPSGVLGAVETTPTQLAQLWTALARADGRPMPLQYLRRITTRDGQVVWEAPTTPLNVQGIPAEVRNPLRQLLEDVVNRGTGSRVRTAGYVGPVAGKTGTTNGGHDLWFAGFTPSRVGVVWMGLDQPATVLPGADGTGGRQAAPLWATVMRVGMTTVDSLPWPVVRDTTTTVPPVPEDSGMIPVVPIAQAADEVPMRWCLRDRTAADTGSVVNLVVPCPETP